MNFPKGAPPLILIDVALIVLINPHFYWITQIQNGHSNCVEVHWDVQTLSLVNFNVWCFSFCTFLKNNRIYKIMTVLYSEMFWRHENLTVSSCTWVGIVQMRHVQVAYLCISVQAVPGSWLVYAFFHTEQEFFTFPFLIHRL